MADVDGTAELRLFIKQLGKMPTDIRQDLRPKLKGIGQAALFSVRFQASWSTRIPRATRLQIGLSKRNPGIAIVVNKNQAPHARPFENGGQPGTFRHPVFWPRERKVVFGVERPDARIRDRWVNQTARPFLAKGARPHFAEVDRELKDVVDAAARKAGFR
ncbi:hypothetical protein Ssi03_62670 [Sphaerisporangium siamense]|uniref:HK97 gp10 family phage protein n=1 Tax=Sphaerisporangium siamense TaxID=795645 RepID=A0A7W7DAV4_9ACTN|nr:HK97 gp10 family phage protein [Sphaerisporangium siamense]MBB4702575.1 hypothetical protein [Sphaerisporangium siamense]GII88277.1 hypothetical protein Ssi03_62670 [Sphaerisporangium siamense]